jgi:Family of unknown function (DUF5670)
MRQRSCPAVPDDARSNVAIYASPRGGFCDLQNVRGDPGTASIYSGLASGFDRKLSDTFQAGKLALQRFPHTHSRFPQALRQTFDNKTESEEVLSVGCSSLSKLEVTMLWTIFVILLVLWLLGLVSSYTLGGFIHILLVVALVVLVINLLSGRRSAI